MDNILQKSLNGQLLLMASLAAVDGVEIFIARGAEVNTTDEQGWTPLMHAVLAVGNARGRIRAVRINIVAKLLWHGADVNHRADDGETALSIALKMGHKDLAKLFLAQGAEIESRNN